MATASRSSGSRGRRSNAFWVVSRSIRPPQGRPAKRRRSVTMAHVRLRMGVLSIVVGFGPKILDQLLAPVPRVASLDRLPVFDGSCCSSISMTSSVQHPTSGRRRPAMVVQGATYG
jgi:hypothetical protein